LSRRRARARREQPLSRPLILCYHGVADGWEHQLAVRPLDFERQLTTLVRRRFRPAAATDAIAGRGRLLHVTFDDAYRNVADNAVPVLEQLGFTATIFTASGFAADGRPLDIPELASEARAHPDEMRTLSWQELRALAERGFEIGSHTVTHPHLPRLSDAELERELAESRARCEQELARACRFIAYPFGEHDARVQAAARRAGYEAAFGLRAGTDRANRFALPRVDFYRRDSLLRAMLKSSFVRGPATSVLDRARARR
jgi:peptidoglycan/xylan/chitin deacetylase (PgdA/CDA1 family)